MTNLDNTARLALSLLKEAGADGAACAVSVSEKREFNMEGGQFSLFRTLFNNSLSLSVIKGGRHGNVHGNHLDEDSVREAAKQVMDVTESGEVDPAWDMAHEAEGVNAAQGAREGDMNAFFARVRELAEDIARLYPRILIEQLIASHTKVENLYQNSYGVRHSVCEGRYDVEIVCSGHEGDNAGSFCGTGVATASLDKPFIQLGSIAQELADTEKQIYTQPLAGKFEGVALFPPACLRSMLYQTLGLFTGDRALLEGTSIWKDKLGQRVADERITLSLNPRDARVVCGERYTGEGFVSEDYDVIQNGVLKSFTLGLYAANKTGMPRALNASGNMVMTPGEKPLDEIIAGIRRGIVVGRFSGGEPGANGDFSGVAKNSFLIENGKITSPLSETMINGNLAEMLTNLVSLSRETVSDGETCLPYAAFGGITISGK